MSKQNNLPTGKTQLDRQREMLTRSIATRMQHHVMPDPAALEESEIIVDRPGWLSIDDLQIAALIMLNSGEYDEQTARTEALRRDIIV